MEEESNTNSSFLPLSEGRDFLPLKKSSSKRQVVAIQEVSDTQSVFIILSDLENKKRKPLTLEGKRYVGKILSAEVLEKNKKGDKSFCTNILRVEKDGVCINGEDVSYLFSDNEIKLLSLLRDKNGACLSKDEIAVTLWGDEYIERYSEPAITQAVRRIRLKLLGLGVSRNVIKTAHGKGYVLKL